MSTTITPSGLTPSTVAVNQPVESSSSTTASTSTSANSTSPDIFESSSVGAGAQPSAKKVQVFYRWTSQQEADGLTKTGGLTLGNIRQYIDNDANFIGDGIYMAESPMTAQMYGDSLVEVWVDQDLIKDGYFAKFGGIGRDWWLGQVDEAIEAGGVDIAKLDANDYTEYGNAQKLLSDVGIYYREFTGSTLSREELEVLANYSEGNKGARFQEALEQRTYLWSTDANGKLSAIEYNGDGYEVGPLAAKYCTAKNQREFKAYTGDGGAASQTSATYAGLEPVGYDNDLKALSNKNIVYKAWVLWKAFRNGIVDWFTGK